ncbi:hypothetical protein LSH36_381g00018 [Paralvinella palmiformis]|uniref:C-type lectin domain-containing protein n=1 Tax=Paralvinella palmiformis TaxID=53620 RepID=A0AAD9MZ92_9ANNE|nr:hypothetical protein LSH36_381g00018 [Paralvinella palmiformis]
MKWINPSRTFGTCTLLEEVFITSSDTGSGYDVNYTHHYWCPEKMTYNLRTGVCIANKSEVHRHAGESFCTKLHPGAHLIDIIFTDEYVSSTILSLSESFDDIWTSAISSAGDGNNFYWQNSGKALIYTNWAPYHLNIEVDGDTYVMIRRRLSYHWDGCRCWDNTATALCEW